MKEKYWNDTELVPSPCAGTWALVYSVACVALGLPMAIMFALGTGLAVAYCVLLLMFALGLLFLIWAFIIGGKYTRWLGAFWALLLLMCILDILVVLTRHL
jgi:hypothetical protein